MATNPNEINPLKWPLAARIALLLMTLVGIAFGVIVGYLVYGIAKGAEGGISFEYWLSRPFRYLGFWWGVAGAAAGAALGYARRTITK